MLIIKPHGKSVVKHEQKTRKIKKTHEAEPTNITEFVKNYPQVVLAQWISVIDKIIAKPEDLKALRKNDAQYEDKKKQAEESKKLRKILGDAAWEKADISVDKKLWDWKIEATQPKPPKDIKGRWYKAFLGNLECNKDTIEKNKEDIAKKIHEHLFKNAFRFPPKADSNENPRRHDKGLIEQRARSIESNTLKYEEKSRIYTDSDRIKYRGKAYNIAQDIKAAILKEYPKPNPDDKKQNTYREPPYNIAVGILKEKWKQAFGNLGHFNEVKKEHPEQLDLHLQIKDTYKRLLKGKKKLDFKKLEKILPVNDHALFELIEKQKQNQDINHLIRLGKIIHYEASDKVNSPKYEKTTDSVEKILTQWPSVDEVQKSRFWSSDGQTVIKQNESFVRVWRNALAFSARTLKDWADPEGKINGDILLGKLKEEALKNFGGSEPDKKYQLLFGKNLSKDETKAILKFALQGIYNLRSAAFHFKGMRVFVDTFPKKENTVCTELYNTHREEYRKRCVDVMKANHFYEYFGRGEIEKFLQELTANNQPSLLPLPRLKRVLKRAENTWMGKDKISLPPYSTAEEREANPWARCQYTATKFLYDKPFKHWMESQDNGRISQYIQRALKQTTEAAKKLNGKGDDEPYRDLIVAKAEKIDLSSQDVTFENFFFKLTAATAEEHKKSYQPDAKKSKEQASYIEKFKCDVVALAFADYLKETVKDIESFCKKDRTQKPEENFGYKSLRENILASISTDTPTQKWQPNFYFLLHLMPIEEAGILRQQLKKWAVVTQKSHGKTEEKTDEAGREKETLSALLEVFDLYIAMHDAQFVEAKLNSLSVEEWDSEKNTLTSIAKKFFENEKDFEAIFKTEQTNSKSKIEYLALRDLREMHRFGSNTFLDTYTKFKIPTQKIKRWKELEETIADKQKKLKQLHEEWVDAKNKNQWLKSNDNEYKHTLEKVEEYRHLTSQVKLQNHLRLHRLSMKILSRLVDFSGLWERDLYFVLLSQLHPFDKEILKKKFDEADPDIEDDKSGSSYLELGRIVEAFIKLNDPDIKEKITHLLGIKGVHIPKKDKNGNNISFKEELESLKNKDYIPWLRNRFAHLSMLEKDNLPVNLTCEVNNARQLMEHDRKLKNAVSKAIIDLLKKENLELEWAMNGDHKLDKVSSLCPIQANHLNGNKIQESLHGKDFVNMVYALFGGTGEAPCKDKNSNKKTHRNNRHNTNNQNFSRGRK